MSLFGIPIKTIVKAVVSALAVSSTFRSADAVPIPLGTTTGNFIYLL